MHKISTTLRNEVLIKGHTKNGSPQYIISEAALERVYDRLCERLQHFHSSHAGFQHTSKYTAHFKHVFLHGKGTFTAVRMVMLMPAIIFVLSDLLKPGIEIIRRELPNMPSRAQNTIRSDGSLGRHGGGLEQFLDWFIKARSMLFPMEDAPELQELARLMKKLQNVISQKNLAKLGSSVEFSKGART